MGWSGHEIAEGVTLFVRGSDNMFDGAFLQIVDKDSEIHEVKITEEGSTTLRDVVLDAIMSIRISKIEQQSFDDLFNELTFKSDKE